MKLLVAIKRVVDYNVKIRVKGDGSDAVSYTHLTLPTSAVACRSRWSPYH